MPAVSIVLPTCDRPVLVERALGSLLRQSFTDFEVLLVDANRRTGRVAENPRLAGLLRDPRVRVIDGRATRTAAMARNAGLRAARGQWVTFLDDDDEYRPDKVAAQHALALSTGCPFVLCGYEFVWPLRRRTRQVAQARFRGDDILTRAHLATPVIFSRRDDTLLFDEHLRAGEDTSYALELILRHNLRELPCVTRALVVVHPQPGNTNVHANHEAVWQGYRAAGRLARRHFSRPACRALMALGRLERAMAGHGGAGHFWRCVFDVLRTRGLREWRLVAFAVQKRMRSR